MSSENQEYRRRPFSVNDLNRRTREVKIFNTTTITTTTSTTTHDSSISTTTVTNRGNPQISTTSNNNYVLQNIQDNQSARRQESRSKSAFDNSYTTEQTRISNAPYHNTITQTTNTSIIQPTSKRKLKFVYGDEQQNIDPTSLDVRTPTSKSAV